VGLLPVGAEGASAFFNVIDARYERGHPTLVTINRGLPAWGELREIPAVDPPRSLLIVERVVS
jgi:DNA replication protein DnaC